MAPELERDSEIRSKVLEWYGILSSRRVDLVGDYAGQELFLLEGDSLLLHCFADPRLDFNDGFQLLHAAYAVEYFIQGLIQRKCNLKIVFFDEHKELCVPRNSHTIKRQKYLFARSAIIRHLRMNLQESHPTIEVHIFQRIRSKDFIDFLKITGVYFVMCHDGANPVAASNDPAIQELSKEAQVVVEQQESTRKLLFRAMICFLINQGYNVALINGLEWQDTKIMTMVVEGSRRARTLIGLFPEPIQASKRSPHNADMADFVESSRSKLGLDLDTSKLNGEHPTQPKSTTAVQQNHGHDLADGDAELLTERSYVGILTLAALLKSNPDFRIHIVAFLLHMALIQGLGLSSRHLRLITPEKKADPQAFLAAFSKQASDILETARWDKFMASESVACDVIDAVDGRLFLTVLQSLKRVFQGVMSEPRLASHFAHLVRSLNIVNGTQIDASEKGLPSNGGKPPNIYADDFPSTSKASILPFSSPIFDKHLTSIKISVVGGQAPRPESAKIFQEVTHWHNAKRRLDAKAVKELTGREKGRALRRNQFFMAEMFSYAASLTNAAGKSLEPETITVGEAKRETTKTMEANKENEPKPKASKNPGSKAGSNRKNIGKQAMLSNIAASKAAKDEDVTEKTFKAWETARKIFDSETQPSSRFLKAKNYLNDLRGAKRKAVEAEVEFYKICVLLGIYKELSKVQDSKGRHSEHLYGVASMLWDALRRLTSSNDLTKTIVESAREVARSLGLPPVVFPAVESTRQLSFSPSISLSNLPKLPLSSNPKDFQLLHCGPYMDRNLDSAPDPRVPFEPDGWQRKVLDELEADRSIFVVAPTSAGKTFISFYAMERILRADNDSVLVYVAPTKALVNQIAAEIQARFNKSYKYNKSVWAIHTRDYRINNPNGCQILVTVPHILQIMLLSPSNAKSWSPRLKYIIFDEIHSIGQAEDGVVWEQLLLLAPCPIIALSATVGNPEQFNSWLKSTQESIGNQLTMITHPHRYSDLRKFIYTPPKKFAFHGLADKGSFATLGLDGLEGLAFVHPVASLVNKSRGMPNDLNLEARDCLSLWQAMTRHATKDFPVSQKLDPAVALPDVIRKANIIEWEHGLKDLLRIWMSDDNSPFDDVVEDLSKSMDGSGEDIQTSKRYGADASTEAAASVDPEFLRDTTLPLLCKLNERDALPAIFFNYDRNRCEGICQSILDQLVAAEERWKKESNVWKNKLEQWEQWKKAKAKMASKRPSKPASKKKGKNEDDDPMSKADQVQDAASSEVDPWASFNPDDPIDGFHFAAKHKSEKAELATWFYQLTKRGVQPWLMDALSRGIGVHHAGMNRKYRQVVEMLFRKGFLRVVIATGTLALGINMPCATVVFAGDSIFLTALNFRQAAGRAGRRGFDLLGNVVFQNISKGKVCRLLSSRLPDLNGHFPITTTLVLRLFTLLHESGDAPYAIKAINSLLSQPRLYLDGSAFREQVLHHLRFSIEYLRRQSLLSSQGAPINFAGLTSHLYYTENSSFALNALIKEGFFHEVCADINEKQSSVLRELMIVMAHLFGRRPCREADQEYLEAVIKPSSSIVFLPELPYRASKILQRHNKETLQTFTTYVETFVDQHITEPDTKLPLTGLSFGGTDSKLDIPSLPLLPPTKVRSAFVALSGHGDNFSSIPELCRTARGGVFLEEAVIPHLDVYPDESKIPLNAYLYDFFMHGNVDPLEKANGIRKSDVWFLLNDFSMVLATITASLASFLKLSDTDVSMDMLSGAMDQSNTQQDDIFAADTVVGSDDDASSVATLVDRGKTIAAASLTPAKTPTKKKVVESWDASDDEGEDGGEDDDEDGPATEVGARTVDEMEEGFLKVYKAMTLLQKEFNDKFFAMWA